MEQEPGLTVTMSFGDAAKGARERVDEAMDDDKRPKVEVNYRPADGPGQRCVDCGHWQGTDQDTEATCEVVAGTVEASYVSDLFEARGDGPDPRERRRPSAPPFGSDNDETKET